MNEKIDIWLVGNTGLRNPNRIQDGFKVFAGSPFVGNLHGKENEIGFMNYLNEKGIIQNEDGKDESGSHARKWRLMFAKNGFIYPQIKKKDGNQEELGILDDITPFGRSFLKADTYPAVQECYLRAMSVEQFALPDGIHYFSPLRWLLAIMLELEKRTGTSELSRIEFALWGHTTNPSYGYAGFLFLDKNDRPMVALHWEKYMQHIVEKYNKIYRIQMPKVTPHVCRHTFCSNMAKSGMNPKTLQYIMGHSDISVTLNVYTHVQFDDAQAELLRVAEA